MTRSDLVCQRLIAERRPFLSSRFRKVLFTNEVIQVVDRVFVFPPVLQFVLTEMYYDGFHRSFCDDDDDLDIIQESDSIFAFETPETFRLENIRTKRGTPHWVVLGLHSGSISAAEFSPLDLVTYLSRCSLPR